MSLLINCNKMRKMRKYLCKIFGHNYLYYLTQDCPNRQFRCCLTCGQMQEYKTVNFRLEAITGWYSLVQRIAKGAKEFFKVCR